MDWNVSRAHFHAIAAIIDRWEGLCDQFGETCNRMAVSMDLTACHANGCPLDLDGLLAATDGDFGHDVGGIAQHIDRETGKLQDCFSPRFAATG